ncbi:alpha/beta fold hydrolase [Aliidiomarina soli]|uniref:Alpha/beta hydrolase n=1 Tax=Aliidiomarina soli TaxID=1928574 RepID=A0A432WFH2_9GAMM|nr:alpha/beta hydrolase [Aliidiomarina soli]RUO32530.1 alpha/beta hydrolase [Aliidiomarina soli]
MCSNEAQGKEKGDSQPADLADQLLLDWVPWQFQSQYGFTLRGQRTRPRGLPVVHFIHGNSYSGLTYLPLLQALYPYFDIFLHDAQGHGDSDEGGRFIGWNESAELAVEVAERIVKPTYGAVPVIGMGHSFGGILTLLMSQLQPHLFDRLILLDPILFPRRMLLPMRVLSGLHLYQLNPYAKRARKRRSVWPDEATAYAGLHQRGMFKGWQDDALRAYVKHAMHEGADGQWQLKCSPGREAEIFSSYARGLWPYIGKRLAVPTEVWAGLQTYPFVRGSLQRWQSMTDRVTLHWLEGGHCFMQEDPQRTANQVLAALTALIKPEPVVTE